MCIRDSLKSRALTPKKSPAACLTAQVNHASTRLRRVLAARAWPILLCCCCCCCCCCCSDINSSPKSSQFVVTKSAESLARPEKAHQRNKPRVGKHDAFHLIAHETKKAHERQINVQTELTSPPGSNQPQQQTSPCSHNYPNRGH